MQAQDSYRHKLQQLAASIRAWSGFVSDVCRVEVSEEAASCRLALSPFAAGACPIEVVIDGAEMTCDMRIGAEIVRGWRPSSLDEFLPLLKAITEGRVITRRLMSAATGLPLAVSTQIWLEDGRTYVLPPPDGSAPDGLQECRERHWLPYRKPAGHAAG